MDLSDRFHFHGQVAQLVEQRIENPCVAGSIPALATGKLPAGTRKSSRSCRFF
jgi:hypothetical protein